MVDRRENRRTICASSEYGLEVVAQWNPGFVRFFNVPRLSGTLVYPSARREKRAFRGEITDHTTHTPHTLHTRTILYTLH